MAFEKRENESGNNDDGLKVTKLREIEFFSTMQLIRELERRSIGSIIMLNTADSKFKTSYKITDTLRSWLQMEDKLIINSMIEYFKNINSLP